ncbi:MAG TPA: phosphatidate cytidylyltransferase [Steroidobacteraceae bacterium]|nr:phosphatidate cytidylyltransferase [Steroidobacteraceae bacterium]
MLRLRVITALLLAPFVLGAIFFLPERGMAAVLGLLVAAGAWEWSAFAGFTRSSAKGIYVGVVVVCVAALSWVSPRNDLDWVLYAALIWWLIALCWVLMWPGAVSSVSAAIAGLLVLIPAWLALSQLHSHDPQLMLFLLLLVVAADVGAYFAGRRFGRNKLAPRVSPGKTWEGVGGGILGATIIAIVGVAWLKMPFVAFTALCVVVVFASIVGDLTESLFKRHAGLKDSGTLLPGHGGVLDRVDSITAAAPVFLVGLQALGLLR